MRERVRASRRAPLCSAPTMEPKTGTPSPSLCLPTCAAASCYPHLGQPPRTTFPTFPGCFSPSPAGGRAPLPPSQPLLNDSIYRPPILARKEIYVFFQTLAAVCVGFCGGRLLREGGGRQWAGRDLRIGPAGSARQPARGSVIKGRLGLGRPSGGLGRGGAPSLVFVVNPAPPPWPTSEKNMSFDQNGPFFKLVTLRVRAQPAPGWSCILSSSLVTTKNRRPSAEAGLSPPLWEATGPKRGGRPRPWPCGCCRQWAQSRAGLGGQQPGWGPPPTSYNPPGSAEPGRGVREPPRLGTGWRSGGVRGQPLACPGPGGRWTTAGPRPQARTRRAGGLLPPGPAAGAPAWPSGRPKWLTRPFLPGTLAHGTGPAECVYFAEWTASRCPGSERSRGRWKFLWIKHGAEARWLFGLAALPPHPVPRPHSSPGRPFMPRSRPLLRPSSCWPRAGWPGPPSRAGKRLRDEGGRPASPG